MRNGFGRTLAAAWEVMLCLCCDFRLMLFFVGHFYAIIPFCGWWWLCLNEPWAYFGGPWACLNGVGPFCWAMGLFEWGWAILLGHGLIWMAMGFGLYTYVHTGMFFFCLRARLVLLWLWMWKCGWWWCVYVTLSGNTIRCLPVKLLSCPSASLTFRDDRWCWMEGGGCIWALDLGWSLRG
jgi:hypothetical protein